MNATLTFFATHQSIAMPVSEGIAIKFKTLALPGTQMRTSMLRSNHDLETENQVPKPSHKSCND